MVFHGMVLGIVMKQWHFLDRFHNVKGFNILLQSSKPNVLDRYWYLVGTGGESMHQDGTFVRR